MTDEIIPFGKYKGQPVEQVMMRDPAYLQWLKQQPWFAEKFPPIYQIVVNNFAAPSEDTPAHNAMQVRFLEDEYRAAFWHAANVFTARDRELLLHNFRLNTRHLRHPPTAEIEAPLIGKARFEDASDVVFEVTMTVGREHENYAAIRTYRLAIEIKPSMGDDYPAVLRQIKQQRLVSRGRDFLPSHWFLLVEQFAASNVTLDQARAIFAGDDIKMLLTSEV